MSNTSKDEEHELKMQFARALQSPPPQPDRVKRGVRKRGTSGYVDYSRGYESLALSVPKQQVEEMRQLTKVHGLSGITYTEAGRCVIHDRKHRARWAEIRGLHDRDGGYGDG
jgi:hypothetical protein